MMKLCGVIAWALLFGVLIGNGCSGSKAAIDVDANDDFAEELADIEQSVETEKTPDLDEEPVVSRSKAKPTKKDKKRRQTRQSRSSGQPNPDHEAQKKASEQETEDSSEEAFYLNICGGVIAVVYLLGYFRGSSSNGYSAQAWHDACKDLMTDSFAEFGLLASNTTLIQESAHEYVLYGTGRQTCRSMTAKLTLPKIHDLVHVAQTFSLPSESHQLDLTFELKQELIQGFIFAMVGTKKAKGTKENYTDLNSIAKTYKGSSWKLPSEFSVFTDCPDVVPAILVDDVQKFMATFKNEIQMIHYSDFFMGKKVVDPLDPSVEVQSKDPTNAKPILTMSFKIAGSASGDCEMKKNIIAGSILLMDKLSSVRLTGANKKELEQKRAAYKEKFFSKSPEEIKQEAIEKRREEEKADKARYDAMDANNPARVAFEKKMEKKKQKKGQKRGMVSMRR